MDKYLGKRLDGRYEMRELIGVGGMAYVYKAYDVIDDRIVAVKILKDEFLNSDEFVRRFRNESKAIAILNHPNIVKVLDVGFGERLQYIVMEYIDGITLKEYLDQRKDIRWKEAVHFTVQILRALQHAHDKGIVHRDIKPQNIMLLSDGTIKVTDFGIARLTRSDMKATVDGNKAIGSVHYISPEQARGEITDEKTDLYAVGIMLYETLTGRLPFEADNAVSVAIMQMQSEAKAPHLINAEIPEGLEQITLKAMQKDTAKRYQSAAEMLSDFEEFKRNPSIKFEYTYMVDETPTRYVDAITRVRGETTDPSVKGKKETPAPAKRSGANKSAVNKKTTKTVSLIVILCLVTALTIGAVVWLVAWLINGGGRKQVDEVEVKNFIGMMYYTEIDGVNEYKESYDLKIIWEDANNSDRKVGEVFKQSPKNGKKVKKGSTVTLYVNTATPKDISLDVKAKIEGVHKDEVQALLQEAGFEVKEDPRSSELVPADHVIKIDIEPGKSYPHGKVVTMTVSTGVSKLDDIDFPAHIIGQKQDKAIEILGNYEYPKENIKYQKANYTDDAYKEKDTVMGVMIDNVLLTEMPEKISPDVDLTLVVSNGCKDVVVELEWPKDINGKNVDVTLGITTLVNGTPNSDVAKHYAAGKNPYSIPEKMTFTLSDHPVDKKGDPYETYMFVVEIKKHSSSGEYDKYAEVQITPAEGKAELVGEYKHLPGITPEAAIPGDMLNQSFTYKAILDKLDGFKTVTIKLGDEVLAMDNGQTLTVEEILHNGEKVDGETIKFNTPVAANAEVVVKVRVIATAVIPGDVLGHKFSYAALAGKLNGFDKVTIKMGDEIVTAQSKDELTVDEILYDGKKVDGSAIKFGVALPADVEVVVKVSVKKVSVIPELIGRYGTYSEILPQLTGFRTVTIQLGADILTQDDGRKLLIEEILYNGRAVDGKTIQFGQPVSADADITIKVSVLRDDADFPKNIFAQTSRQNILDLLAAFDSVSVESIANDDEVLDTDTLSVAVIHCIPKEGEGQLFYSSDSLPDSLLKTTTVVVYVDVMLPVPSLPLSIEDAEALRADFNMEYQDGEGNVIADPTGWIVADVCDESNNSVVGTTIPEGSKVIVVLEMPQ